MFNVMGRRCHMSFLRRIQRVKGAPSTQRLDFSADEQPMQKDGDILFIVLAIVEHKVQSTGGNPTKKFRARTGQAVGSFNDSDRSWRKSARAELGGHIENSHRILGGKTKPHVIDRRSKGVEPRDAPSFRARDLNLKRVGRVRLEVHTEEAVFRTPSSRHIRFKHQVLRFDGARWIPINLLPDHARGDELPGYAAKPYSGFRQRRSLECDHLIPRT